MISVTYLDIAEVFSLVKVKLNLKICTRRIPLLVTFLKVDCSDKYEKKTRNIHVEQFIFRFLTLELAILPKNELLHNDFKDHVYHVFKGTPISDCFRMKLAL